MTLQAEGKTLWVRCASDDGSVADFTDLGVGRLSITVTNGESEESAAVVLPMAEAMMLGRWLIAAAKGEFPE